MHGVRASLFTPARQHGHHKLYSNKLRSADPTSESSNSYIKKSETLYQNEVNEVNKSKLKCGGLDKTFGHIYSAACGYERNAVGWVIHDQYQ